MNLLLYKITIAPALVALATLAGRRWGNIAAGLVAGMPIVAGPVLFFYALEQGPAYATLASINTLLGILSLCAFVLAYGWRAWSGGSVLSSLLLGWAVFAFLTLLLDQVTHSQSVSLGKAFCFALVGLFLSVVSLPPETGPRLDEGLPEPEAPPKITSKTQAPPPPRPRLDFEDPAIFPIPSHAVLKAPSLDRRPEAPAPRFSTVARVQSLDQPSKSPVAPSENRPLAEVPAKPGPWDLPLRMVSAALLVLVLTAFAERLGPRLGGLLTTFPVASTVLAVFAHRQGGSAAVRAVLKGLLLALNAFAVFCVVLGVALVSWGLLPSFAAALLASALVQAAVIAVRAARLNA